MTNEYALEAQSPFPQIEPEASYWFRCPVLHTVSLEDVSAKLNCGEPAKGEPDCQVVPYPTDAATLDAEITHLKKIYNRREDDLDQTTLSVFLTDEMYTMKPPVGSVVSDPRAGRPLIKTGLELATLFENETPGLWHRHVMNVLLDPSVPMGLGQRLSPPLQSLLWAALDEAITSALMAAWHYKWLATDAGERAVARRQRPVEYDETLPVLYDFRVDRNAAGEIVRTAMKMPPDALPEHPGTPRHPAYPSGHSTYSAAASTVLECFFDKWNGGRLAGEFTKLAEDIGEARLWGGVHWRTDDDAGRIIGNAVGELIIEQLTQTGIYDLLNAEFEIPPFEELKDEADAFDDDCGDEDKRVPFCQGLPKEDEVFQNLQG
jgi:membrane-associated phospholipid phosphatase